MCIQFPEAAMKIKRGLTKYKDENKVFQKFLIKNMDISENLPDEIIEEMSYGLKSEFFEEGQFIIKEGEFNDKIYFICSGWVDVSVTFVGVETKIEQLYKGCSLGLYCAMSSTA